MHKFVYVMHAETGGWGIHNSFWVRGEHNSIFRNRETCQSTFLIIYTFCTKMYTDTIHKKCCQCLLVQFDLQKHQNHWRRNLGSRPTTENPSWEGIFSLSMVAFLQALTHSCWISITAESLFSFCCPFSTNFLMTEGFCSKLRSNMVQSWGFEHQPEFSPWYHPTSTGIRIHQIC